MICIYGAQAHKLIEHIQWRWNYPAFLPLTDHGFLSYARAGVNPDTSERDRIFEFLVDLARIEKIRLGSLDTHLGQAVMFPNLGMETRVLESVLRGIGILKRTESILIKDLMPRFLDIKIPQGCYLVTNPEADNPWDKNLDLAWERVIPELKQNFTYVNKIEWSEGKSIPEILEANLVKARRITLED